MNLSDRIKRWWSPAEWREEHPVESDGEGYALSEEQRADAGTEVSDFMDPPSSDERGPLA
jgi:hypothetical protein